MKTLTQVMRAASQQLRSDQGWVWLYDIELPSATPTRLRLTNNTDPVSFGTSSLGTPLVYSPFPIAHGGMREDAEGDLPTVTLHVGNASREVSAQVELYGGLVGQPVDVRLVYLGELNNPSAQRLETTQIISADVTAEVVRFTLSPYNLYRAKFPSRRHVARHCRFVFGGPECAYKLALGTLTTCRKDYEDCDAHGADEVATGQARQHPERFGGFLGIQRLTAQGF